MSEIPEFKNQKQLFDWVWSNRPHYSELTGKPLFPRGHYLHFNQYLHILSKGKFPHLKLEEKNILLALPEEHLHQDRYEKFNELKVKLLAEIYKK